MPRFRDLPDWRDGRAYEFLFQVERSIFAWEWLRRRPDYRAAAVRRRVRQSQPALLILPEEVQAAQWGLHLFEDPTLPADLARPIWRSDGHPFVLQASAEPSSKGVDAFALDKLRRFATLAGSRDVQHLLLSNGFQAIRIDVRGANLLKGPVLLRYELQGMAAARPPLLVLKRFLALASGGNFPGSRRKEDPTGRRQVLLLRAWDALQDGAQQRTIAAELLSGRAAEMRWRLKAPSLRSQAQRLVQRARAMAGGEFRHLLH